MSQLQAMACNSLPVPALALRGVVEETTINERDDRFPKGRIVKFFPNQFYGFVRDQIGRELFFHVDEIDLLGPRGRKEHIRIGAEVGYDCCRTSHGLRVKRMKIY